MKNEEKSQIYFVVLKNVCDYFKIFGSGAEK